MPSNHPQSRDESPTGDKSDLVEIPNIVKSIIAVYKSIFPIRKQPLPGWQRFLFSWLGSSIMFASVPPAILNRVIIAINNKIRLFGLSEYISTHLSSPVILVLIPSIFALVIASSKTKHGAIGLFLFGLMLTAFVFTFAFRVWANLPVLDAAIPTGR